MSSPSPYVLSGHDPVDWVDASGADPEAAVGIPNAQDLAYISGVGGGYPNVVRVGETGARGAPPAPYWQKAEPPQADFGPSRNLWTRGGGTLTGGAIALGLGALVLASNPAGWFVLLSAGMAVSGGIFGVGMGAMELGLSYSGQTDAADEEQINNVTALTMGMCDPVGTSRRHGWGGHYG